MKKGFTITELLVSVSIISILGGITLALINSTGLRARTRDSNRMVDLEEVKTALELYYFDNRAYPATGVGLAVLSPNYIAVLPTDPSTAANYCYSSNTTDFILATAMEKEASATSAPCASLNNWGSLGGVCSALANCYGVENAN